MRLTGKKIPAPGSLRIMPSRDEAERNEPAFYEVFNEVAVGRARHRQLAAITGTNGSVDSLTKQLKRKSLPPRDRKALSDAMFQTNGPFASPARKAMAQMRDPLYFAMCEALGISETSIAKTRECLGDWKLFRFSVGFPEHVVIAKMTIYEDPISKAIKANLVQRKKAQPNVRAQEELCSGYLYRTSNMFDVQVADSRSKDARRTMFYRQTYDEVGLDTNSDSVVAGRRKHVVTMVGRGEGIDGGQYFSSPVYATFVDDVNELATLDSELDIVHRDDPKVAGCIVNILDGQGSLIVR